MPSLCHHALTPAFNLPPSPSASPPPQVAKVVAPKQAALKVAEEQYNDVMAGLRSKQAELKVRRVEGGGARVWWRVRGENLGAAHA